jgi:hypothetical protein
MRGVRTWIYRSPSGEAICLWLAVLNESEALSILNFFLKIGIVFTDVGTLPLDVPPRNRDVSTWLLLLSNW